MGLLNFVDNLLNSITMYRLVLYGLIFIAVTAILSGFLGLLPYSGLELIFSLSFLTLVCFFTNYLISKILKIPTNPESSFITALILFFIFSSRITVFDITALTLAGIIAMTSKYIFTINKKHIFNPVAITAVVLGVSQMGNPAWWIGTEILTPVVLLVGLLIVRKIRRFTLFFSFLAVCISTIIFFGLGQNVDLINLVRQVMLSSPILFFGFIMLTEPQTAPQTRKLHIMYGALVGFLFSTQFQIGVLYSTPQFALITTNLIFFILNPKKTLILFLKNKTKLSPEIYEFSFINKGKFTFYPGEYLEWTLPHSNFDSRGVRRYFTVASSPTEEEIRLAVRVSEKSSTFKKALLSLTEKQKILAYGPYGDFTLPKNKNEKLVFIAGGIGVTPFRSIIKYLLDTNEKRDIILFYTSSTIDGFVYKEIFDKTSEALGIKVIYVLTNTKEVPKTWTGKTGRLTLEILQKIPDYKKRLYYLSGPELMVKSYKSLVHSLGVQTQNIITDYFSGY